jgi:DNA-directed RNA polymerase specialized sigma24 family protein
MTKDELKIFYKKFFTSLYLYAKSFTKHHEDAEDLTQDAFVFSMKKIKNLKNNDKMLLVYFKNIIKTIYTTESRKNR